MAEAILVVTMCASQEEAERIGCALVDERLVACASWGSGLTSVFRWQGRIERQSEVILLMKTQADLFERLALRIRELHSYQVPEIVALPVVAGDPDYLAWVRESTSGS
jgi:periplasmic divalent cation tolerance protein